MTPLVFYRPRPTRVPYIGVPIAPFAALVFVCGCGAILVGGFGALAVAVGIIAVGTGVLFVITEYDDRALPHLGKRLICRWLHLDRTRAFWRSSAYAPVLSGPRWTRRRRKW